MQWAVKTHEKLVKNRPRQFAVRVRNVLGDSASYRWTTVRLQWFFRIVSRFRVQEHFFPRNHFNFSDKSKKFEKSRNKSRFLATMNGEQLLAEQVRAKRLYLYCRRTISDESKRQIQYTLRFSNCLLRNTTK